jgi:hypothetical protein
MDGHQCSMRMALKSLVEVADQEVDDGERSFDNEGDKSFGAQLSACLWRRFSPVCSQASTRHRSGNRASSPSQVELVSPLQWATRLQRRSRVFPVILILLTGRRGTSEARHSSSHTGPWMRLNHRIGAR